MQKFKVSISVVLLLLVVLFTLQNTEEVTISFIFWHVALSRALMIFLVFCIGFLAGFFFSDNSSSPKDKDLGKTLREARQEKLSKTLQG